MLQSESSIKKLTLWIVIIALGILVLLMMKPIFVAVIGGLLLAYIFRPTYLKIYNLTKKKNISAFTIAIAIILVIIIPLWFVVPLMLQQVFDLFTASQSLNIGHIVSVIFPTASEKFVSQMTVAVGSFIGKITTALLEYLNGLFLDIPIISLNLAIVFFVFFYAVRDYEALKKFIKSISPFTKSKEKEIVNQFENITDSVIYGQIIVGFVQGGLAGLGLLIFGVGNVLVLTGLAIFLSILPTIGPFLIWIPISIYFFASGQTGIGIGYLLYNIIIVSTVDNILRTYLVARKTDLSPAVVFAAMIGGFLVFGMIGLLLGPLIVSYFFMFLQAFRDKKIHALIHEDNTSNIP